jgi:hypothetical protein
MSNNNDIKSISCRVTDIGKVSNGKTTPSSLHPPVPPKNDTSPGNSEKVKQ